MSFRFGLLIALLVLLSVILWFMPREGFKSLNTSSAAPIIEYAPIIYPARKVVQAGPSSPNQSADYSEERMTSPEIAHDPYGPNEESAAHPERLRHPERMFQPAPDNTTHSIAEASGIASASSSQAGHAMSSFTPEFAQNGGEFMQGIMANDTTEPGMYSTF
jgi:hypothetical protein